jgi:hypothetical protein
LLDASEILLRQRARFGGAVPTLQRFLGVRGADPKTPSNAAD